jgi:hypothetical protein
MRSLLSLDPGLGGTGWAYWEIPFKQPAKVGVIKVTRKGEWYDRAQAVADEVERLLKSSTKVVSEFTEFHGAANKSMGWKTGDLQRLTFLCGVIAGRIHPHPFLPVTTSGWKGQLPKQVAAERCKQIIGLNICNKLGLPEIKSKSDTHAWDAVGIGLWALGRF